MRSSPSMSSLKGVKGGMKTSRKSPDMYSTVGPAAMAKSPQYKTVRGLMTNSFPIMDAEEMMQSGKKVKLPPNLQRNTNRSVDPKKKHKFMNYPLSVQNPAFLDTAP